MARDPLHKHTLKLFAGDYESLMDFYPETGAAYVVRMLVRNHLKKLRASTTDAAKDLELPDVRD